MRSVNHLNDEPGMLVKIPVSLATPKQRGSLDGLGIASVCPGTTNTQLSLETTSLEHSFLTPVAY